MGKSLVYAANTATQAVPVNGTINFGNVVRRYGCDTNVAGGILNVSGIGYYSIDANFEFEGTGTGVAVITLYKDGAAIPGAVAKRSTAADTTYAVTIPTEVRQKCCCESPITAVVSGVAINVTNATIRAVKDA